MNTTPIPVLANLTESKRSLALERFNIIRPFPENGVPLTHLVRERGIPLRTAWRWVKLYQSGGLSALVPKATTNKTKRKLSPLFRQVIEGLALQKPRLSVAAIYRKATALAREHGETLPTYSNIYRLIRRLEAVPKA